MSWNAAEESQLAICERQRSASACVCMRYLGCCIVWAATASLQEMAIPHHIAEAKIGNLDVHLAVKQQVFWLEVPMNHHVAMAVLHPRDDLLEETPGFFFQKPAFLNNVVKELPRLQPRVSS